MAWLQRLPLWALVPSLPDMPVRASPLVEQMASGGVVVSVRDLLAGFAVTVVEVVLVAAVWLAVTG